MRGEVLWIPERKARVLCEGKIVSSKERARSGMTRPKEVDRRVCSTKGARCGR